MKMRAHRMSGALSLLLLAALAGCGGEKSGGAKAAESVTGLRTETVRMETVPDEAEAPGTVRSAVTAQVAAQVMGTVVEVRVREGDKVRRGDLLVRLDDREPVARVNAARSGLEGARAEREQASRGLNMAQAQADLAQKTFERFKYLRDQKSVSAQEFDEVDARNRSAQAGLGAAKARREQVEAGNARAESELRAAEVSAGHARIVAPFDGVVVRRSVEPGMMASPGMPLVELEDASRYRMEATIPASVVAARGVKRGTSARVRLDALPGREFEGTVVELEAGAEASSQTMNAKVQLPRDPALRSGLFGRVVLCCGERRAITVLPAALVERGQLQGVYVAGADGILRLRLVTLGQRFASGRVEVLSGLDEGERIVVNPRTQSLDGKRLEAGR